MRQMMNRWCAALVMLIVAGACSTEVELCYCPHPHRAMLDICYDWKNTKEEDIPEHMYVIAYRVVNAYKYCFRTTTMASGNKGVMLFPAIERIPLDEPEQEPDVPDSDLEVPEPDEPTESGEPDEPDMSGSEITMPETDAIRQNGVGELENESDDEDEGQEEEELPETSEIWHKLQVRDGEYQFLAFSAGSEAFEIDGLEEFEKNPDYPLEEMQLTYKTYNRDDELFAGYRAWKDYNPYSKFVLSEVSPMYYTRQEGIKMQLNGTKKIVFTPVPITQRIKVEFTIKKEPGVVVEALLAEMGGIPEGMQFTTGYMNIDHTNKLIFIPHVNVKDNAGSTSVTCVGEMNVTSIVPSYDRALVTGPGIMQVVVYTRVDGAGGRVHRKAIQCLINLYETLRKARLLEWDEDGKHYKQRVSEAILRIENVLEIKEGSVVDSDDSTGLDTWRDMGTIDVDA